jgi:hypothetical protein
MQYSRNSTTPQFLSQNEIWKLFADYSLGLMSGLVGWIINKVVCPLAASSRVACSLGVTLPEARVFVLRIIPFLLVQA